MSLFQISVLKKYLKQQDNEAVAKAYKKFTKYFHNPKIQENIRSSKEEEYQGIFLTELFSTVLEYTMKPNTDFNLVAEYKNEKNSKKADGAILKDGQALGVIELKGTNTKDLEKVRQQAFDYKANQSGCVYVITSNFEKLRFYINNAVDFEEFDLFNLKLDRFELLYLCLAKENILNNLPLKIKEESVQEEEKITKWFYDDYSLFKRELFRDLVKQNMKNEVFRAELNNADTDRVTKNIKRSLFKKSQKLIDRFLFIFFAEDRGLLPPNSTLKILKQWNKLKELDEVVPLYSRFQKYFTYLDQGRKGTNGNAEIFAYNGGLFKPDPILNSLSISDELLFNHTEKLAGYDFNSQVDVNILGHIFENSLNEIESVNAEIEGTDFDKQTTKRKKDGVFYTPKYITKYMVDNTVGKLCAEKKAELGIETEINFVRRADGKLTQKAKDYYALLEQYREWLLQITIVDPACGSGAFLNQALNFLITEHAFITEQVRHITGDASAIFIDIEKTILENNIFGVDINEESVEIAKLSLWLRTAQPRRKLNDLSSNIKCGNSLIDSKSIAGDKAFKWEEEFAGIFSNGGFDVVIGNPPYVQLQSMGQTSDALANCAYETFHKGADLYCLFTERGYKLLKEGGLQSFIMPNKWMIVAYGKPLRKFLSKTGLRQILNFGDIQFFEEATTYVCIFVTQKDKANEQVEVLSLNRKTYHGDFLSEVKTNLYAYPTNNFGENNWSIQPYVDACKLEQMKLSSTDLKDLPISIYRGILTGYNDAFFIDEETKEKLVAADAKSTELIKPMVRGRDISAYGITDFEYLIGTFPSLNLDIENYPAIKEHLLTFGYDRLKQTGDKGSRKKTTGKWFEIQDSIAYYQEFDKPKIIYPNMTSVFPFTYDESGMQGNDKSFILTAKDNLVSLQFLTALFNSSLAKLWIWYNCPELQGGTREIRKVYFEHFPVPQANEEQSAALSQNATERAQLTSYLQTQSTKFQRAIQRKFELETLPKKLQEWYLLSFSDFIKELRKKKIKLTLPQEAEWEDYFLLESGKALTIKAEIDRIDKEIDRMVYGLYGLAEEEIGIEEGELNGN